MTFAWQGHLKAADWLLYEVFLTSWRNGFLRLLPRRAGQSHRLCFRHPQRDLAGRIAAPDLFRRRGLPGDGGEFHLSAGGLMRVIHSFFLPEGLAARIQGAIP